MCVKTKEATSDLMFSLTWEINKCMLSECFHASLCLLQALAMNVKVSLSVFGKYRTIDMELLTSKLTIKAGLGLIACLRGFMHGITV